MEKRDGGEREAAGDGATNCLVKAFQFGKLITVRNENYPGEA